jgi:solute carrier family 50 protein (sugar transporter)
MEYESFLSVLSVTATTSTFALFLCGLQICARIRARNTTDGTSIAPFLLTLISCTFWLGYGDLRNDGTIIFVNGVGFIVQSLYLAYYYRKTRLKVSSFHQRLSIDSFFRLDYIACSWWSCACVYSLIGLCALTYPRRRKKTFWAWSAWFSTFLRLALRFWMW